MEIAIKQCKSSGIDCKVWGLTISGRIQYEDDRTGISFSFLASDGEDQEGADSRGGAAMLSNNASVATINKKAKISSNQDTQTRIFVWGLNDKDQLGGPKGSKVHYTYLLLTIVFNVVILCLVG